MLLAYRMTGSVADADDVVQEAWLAALRHPPEVGPGARGWLATVVRNVLRQSRRSGARRAPPPADEDGVPPAADAPTSAPDAAR